MGLIKLKSRALRFQRKEMLKITTPSSNRKVEDRETALLAAIRKQTYVADYGSWNINNAQNSRATSGPPNHL